MIEKWRPAKAGDSGKVARFRDANDGHWRIGKLERIYSDGVGGGKFFHFFNGVEWFLHCEVLVAYLDDAEVEALACRVAGELMDYGQGTSEQRYSFSKEVIETHFEQGE